MSRTLIQIIKDLPANIKEALGMGPTSNGPFYTASANNPFATQQQIDNLRDGGVFGKQGSPISVGGLSIPITGNFSAAIYIDNIDNDVFTASSNPQGNILTFSTSGAPYSIPLNFFYQSYGWLNISYEYSTNTLRLYYPYGGSVSNTIIPPLQLAALTNITNSFENGYIRKAYFWTNQLFDDNEFYYLNRNDGVLDSNLFIGPKKPSARWEPNSIAFNGVSNIWYDTSGNGYDAVVLGFMVDPQPWATYAALLNKADLIAGKIPAAQLPSYVDDVLEFPTLLAFPVTGETGKIYDALDTNITYRWSGSGYTEISSSLALGETLATAYRGDRGKIAYDHSQTIGNPHNTQIADITGLQTALNDKVNNPLFALGNTTTNALTTLFSTAIPTDTNKTIRYHLKGRSATTGNRFAAECWFEVDNTGGVTTIIGTLSIDRKSSFINAVQTSVTITGGNICNINITGPNGQTVVWELYVREIL